MIEDIKEYVDANGRLIDQQPVYYKMLNVDERLFQGK